MTSEAVRNVPPFKGEERITPWGWIAVGSVIAGTMAVGAWLLSRVDSFNVMSSEDKSANGRSTGE
jgi:hypothetical protein